MEKVIRSPRRLRCAIYTRKSSEEGLDMEFNSLDAQREACEAYAGREELDDEHDECKDQADDGGNGGRSEQFQESHVQIPPFTGRSSLL